MIYVSYSSSDSYSWIMGISIVSLLENNKDERFHIYILDNGICEDNKSKIQWIAKQYKAIISFVDFRKYNGLINVKINPRWDAATFARLFLSKLIPENIDKIIHIDCDTIINGSIGDLWKIKIDNFAVAGVKDCLSKNYNKCLHIDSNNPLLNAGVLVFNLKYIRQNSIHKMFVNKISCSKRLMYLDQDIINSIISKEEKLILHPMYNFYSLFAYCSYEELVLCRNPNCFYSKSAITEAKEKPIIIHFTSSSFDIGRPWNLNNNHPFKNLFLFYKSISPFENVILNKCKPSLKIKIFKLIPRRFGFLISRVVNSFLKPIVFKNI